VRAAGEELGAAQGRSRGCTFEYKVEILVVTKVMNMKESQQLTTNKFWIVPTIPDHIHTFTSSTTQEKLLHMAAHTHVQSHFPSGQAFKKGCLYSFFSTAHTHTHAQLVPIPKFIVRVDKENWFVENEWRCFVCRKLLRQVLKFE
jgi:hypothetical protein